jgi:hypothetical protein
LFDGRGEGKLEVSVTRLETEKEIYRYSKWYHFPAPGMVIHVESKLKKLVIPAPGRYVVVLTFDEHEIARQYLDVARE